MHFPAREMPECFQAVDVFIEASKAYAAMHKHEELPALLTVLCIGYDPRLPGNCCTTQSLYFVIRFSLASHDLVLLGSAFSITRRLGKCCLEEVPCLDLQYVTSSGLLLRRYFGDVVPSV